MAFEKANTLKIVSVILSKMVLAEYNAIREGALKNEANRSFVHWIVNNIDSKSCPVNQ